MNELALFAGAGGGILGGKLLGWRTVCAVERDAYAAQVLAQRQNDGILEAFPIWSDVQHFDGRPWRGIVDVVSGGFPCQDISAAGKGAGIEGSRSGLWAQFARIIGEVRPRYVFVENSPLLVSRGLGTVLGDLAAMRYDTEWIVLGAKDAGAPHKRDRIWILAHAAGHRGEPWRPEPTGRQGGPEAFTRGPSIPDPLCQGLPKPEQPAFLGARGGQERGTTRELHSSLSDTDSHEYEGEPHEGSRQGETQGAEVIFPDTDCINGRPGTGGQDWPQAGYCGWWAVEPALGGTLDGLAPRVDEH